jgi:hypothetical protein
MVLLLQMIAPRREYYAVFVNDKGQPDISPVVAIGAYQGQDGYIMPAGIVMRKHLIPADSLRTFVGYAMTDDPEPWRQACRAHHEALVEEDKKAAENKIILPNEKLVVPRWTKEMQAGE